MWIAFFSLQSIKPIVIIIFLNPHNKSKLTINPKLANGIFIVKAVF
jgi:hypothetical protein